MAIINNLGMSELRIQVTRFLPVANRRVYLLRDHPFSLLHPTGHSMIVSLFNETFQTTIIIFVCCVIVHQQATGRLWTINSDACGGSNSDLLNGPGGT